MHVAGMARARFWFVNVLILTFIGGHVFCLIRDEDYFPFSVYPMVSFVPPDHQHFQIYGITENGAEFPVRDERFVVPFYNFMLCLSFNELAVSPKIPDDARERRLNEAVRDIWTRYESRRTAGLHSGPPLRGMRLYRVHWSRIDTNNLDAPDDRTLIAEFFGKP